MIYIIYRMIDGLTWLMMFWVTIAVNIPCVTKLRVNIIGEALVIKHSLFTTSHISAIALYGGDQSIKVLWRHANTYCDVMMTHCPQNVSYLVMCVWSPSKSWESLVNYRVRFTAFSPSSVTEIMSVNKTSLSWRQWRRSLNICMKL